MYFGKHLQNAIAHIAAALAERYGGQLLQALVLCCCGTNRTAAINLSNLYLGKV